MDDSERLRRIENALAWLLRAQYPDIVADIGYAEYDKQVKESVERIFDKGNPYIGE